MIFENVLKEGINIACNTYFAVRSICLPLIVGSRVERKKTPAVENEPLPIQTPRGDTHFVQFKEEQLKQLGHFSFLEGNRNWYLKRTKAGISGIPLSPPSPPRLEVVGARKNGSARGRHAETPVLSCAHYFQAPATQAKNIIEMAFLGEHAVLPHP